MLRWVLPISWLRLSKGFESWHLFRNGGARQIILGESDPEGCAACSARNNPQNSYRNGPLYAAYTAETLNDILFLAGREHINVMGAVTWAFEFEDQPYFEGYRTLATNGVDKPVLNAFRIFGLLGNNELMLPVRDRYLPRRSCAVEFADSRISTLSLRASRMKSKF